DDGRGEGPLAASLSRWPPTLAGPLLGRRADGELFWHVVAGMRGRDGQPTMPAFGTTLGDADVWAVIDYMKALSAGTGARLQGTWPTPLA
ncbi:cytochrome c, partial [Paraburkholderia sp. SIMBA_050]